MPAPVPDQDLLVASRTDPGSTTVVLTGILDMSTIAEAQREVEAAEEAAPATLVLDYSGLEFVDSTGVRLALLAEHRAREAGRTFAVVLGDGLARRIFDVLGLIDRLDVRPAG